MPGHDVSQLEMQLVWQSKEPGSVVHSVLHQELQSWVQVVVAVSSHVPAHFPSHARVKLAG